MSRAERRPAGRGLPTIADLVVARNAPDQQRWERRLRAVAMRKIGMLYSEIAEKMEVSETQVRKDVEVVYRELTSEAREHMVARQRSIIFDFQRVNYPAALGKPARLGEDGKLIEAAIAPDLDAQRTILASLDHEARLFGLYAPAQVAVGISTTDFAEKMVALIEELDREPPKELLAAAGSPLPPTRPSSTDSAAGSAASKSADSPTSGGLGSKHDILEVSAIGDIEEKVTHTSKHDDIPVHEMPVNGETSAEVVVD